MFGVLAALVYRAVGAPGMLISDRSSTVETTVGVGADEPGAEVTGVLVVSELTGVVVTVDATDVLVADNGLSDDEAPPCVVGTEPPESSSSSPQHEVVATTHRTMKTTERLGPDFPSVRPDGIPAIGHSLSLTADSIGPFARDVVPFGRGTPDSAPTPVQA